MVVHSDLINPSLTINSDVLEQDFKKLSKKTQILIALAVSGTNGEETSRSMDFVKNSAGSRINNVITKLLKKDFENA